MYVLLLCSSCIANTRPLSAGLVAAKLLRDALCVATCLVPTSLQSRSESHTSRFKSLPCTVVNPKVCASIAIWQVATC